MRAFTFTRERYRLHRSTYTTGHDAREYCYDDAGADFTVESNCGGVFFGGSAKTDARTEHTATTAASRATKAVKSVGSSRSFVDIIVIIIAIVGWRLFYTVGLGAKRPPRA